MEPVTHPVRVLIVDDSGFMRTVLASFLANHPVLQLIGVAANGQEALDRVVELQPDVVMTDLEMPVMDGAEFVRTQMSRKPIAIVVVSALAREAPLAAQALLWGAVDMLTKPADLSEVLAHKEILLQKVLAAVGRA